MVLAVANQVRQESGSRVSVGLCVYGTSENLRYRIYAGFSSSFKEKPSLAYPARGQELLVAVEEIPNRWRKDMVSYLSEKIPQPDPFSCIYNHGQLVYVGFICYAIRERHDAEPMTVAITTNYSPRSDLWRGCARGIPYWIEFITTTSLEAYGVTHIRTSDDPSDLRIRQLERVGLPTMEEVEIVSWLRGLRRGVENPDLALPFRCERNRS